MKKVSAAVVAFAMLVSCLFGNIVAYAEDTTLDIKATVYDLDEDSHYVIGENKSSDLSAIGTLSIGGGHRSFL